VTIAEIYRGLDYKSFIFPPVKAPGCPWPASARFIVGMAKLFSSKERIEER
jgi:hypothetical protein